MLKLMLTGAVAAGALMAISASAQAADRLYVRARAEEHQ